MTTEIWTFECQRCELRWEEVYEGWHANDGHGGDVVSWRSHGIVCCPPWCDATCPTCHGGAKVLPSHWHDQKLGWPADHGHVARPRRSA